MIAPTVLITVTYYPLLVSACVYVDGRGRGKRGQSTSQKHTQKNRHKPTICTHIIQYVHLQLSGSLSLMWIDHLQSPCRFYCMLQKPPTTAWSGLELRKHAHKHSHRSYQAAVGSLTRQRIRLTVCFIWQAFECELSLPHTQAAGGKRVSFIRVREWRQEL